MVELSIVFVFTLTRGNWPETCVAQSCEILIEVNPVPKHLTKLELTIPVKYISDDIRLYVYIYIYVQCGPP